MNYLDVVIIVPTFIYIIKGFTNGLIKEIASLAAIIIGLYAAINFSILIEPRIETLFDIEEKYKAFSPILAFTLVFVFTLILIRFIGFLIDRIAGALSLGIISKIFGGIFGGGKILVIISFVLFFEKNSNIISQKTKETSVLFPYTQEITKVIIPKIEKHKNKTEEIKKEIQKTKEVIEKNYKKGDKPGSSFPSK